MFASSAIILVEQLGTRVEQSHGLLIQKTTSLKSLHSLSRFFSRYLSFPNAEVQNQEESAAVCLLLCGNTLWFGTLVALWGKVHLTRSGSKGLGPLTVKFSNHSRSLSLHTHGNSRWKLTIDM